MIISNFLKYIRENVKTIFLRKIVNVDEGVNENDR